VVREDGPVRVIEVVATVELEGDEEKAQRAAVFRASDTLDAERIELVVQNIMDPSRYQMYASLAANLSDGRHVSTGVRDLGFSGPRDGFGAIVHRYRGPQLSQDPDEHQRLLDSTYHVGLPDLEDAINQMLGRDPELHRPPRLSWEKLRSALTAEGLEVTEDDLIAAPLTLELSDAVRAEIRANYCQSVFGCCGCG
jgi:hypothetical protein